MLDSVDFSKTCLHLKTLFLFLRENRISIQKFTYSLKYEVLVNISIFSLLKIYITVRLNLVNSKNINTRSLSIHCYHNLDSFFFHQQVYQRDQITFAATCNRHPSPLFH